MVICGLNKNDISIIQIFTKRSLFKFYLVSINHYYYFSLVSKIDFVN